ncbi:transposase [Mesorhizobium sp. M0025]
MAQSWRRNWLHVVTFFAFPESVRRIIYTTNARGAFPFFGGVVENQI